MLQTVEAVISNGVITPTEPVELVEGSRALVTILDDDESSFWLAASEPSLAEIWDNPEDDVYAELLTK
ncbi:MAG: antitoxin family protein [Pyrinomonadaceae bacterium]